MTLHQWKEEEKSLIASWDKAQLLLPEGPVSFYEVEYRDGEQGLSNKVHVQPDASFFIIHGVENGNKYEVSHHGVMIYGGYLVKLSVLVIFRD